MLPVAIAVVGSSLMEPSLTIVAVLFFYMVLAPFL
jgi:hypothetical protein